MSSRNVFGCGLLVAVLLVQGCGTTSSLRTEEGDVALDLSRYDRVEVLDFVDQTDKDKIKPEKRALYEQQVDTATRTFADMLAAELEATGAFREIHREPVEASAVRISGAITRFQEGNAAMRLLIGLGAGSSYFDANVHVLDNTTEESLARIVVDKNSWALGGGFAAGQNVENFMRGAAKKIATELALARTRPNGVPVGATGSGR